MTLRGADRTDMQTSLALAAGSLNSNVAKQLASVVRITVSSGTDEIDLGGMVPGGPPRKKLINTTVELLRLFIEDGSSAAANRFIAGAGTADVDVPSGASVIIARDDIANRWRIERVLSDDLGSLAVHQAVGGSSASIPENTMSLPGGILEVSLSSGSGAITLTGIGITNARQFFLRNDDASEDVILQGATTGATSFITPDGADITLTPGDVVELVQAQGEGGFIVVGEVLRPSF